MVIVKGTYCNMSYFFIGFDVANAGDTGEANSQAQDIATCNKKYSRRISKHIKTSRAGPGCRRLVCCIYLVYILHISCIYLYIFAHICIYLYIVVYICIYLYIFVCICIYWFKSVLNWY